MGSIKFLCVEDQNRKTVPGLWPLLLVSTWNGEQEGRGKLLSLQPVVRTSPSIEDSSPAPGSHAIESLSGSGLAPLSLRNLLQSAPPPS